MNAAGRLQSQINATETYDALTYGIKSIELSGSAYGAGPAHVAQIDAAIAAAEGVLGRYIGKDTGTVRLLKAAKQKVAGDLVEIKAAVRAIGGKRQLKLALA